jgi:beta-lactamase class A
MEQVIRRKVHSLRKWGTKHWRKLLIYVGGGVVAVFLILQIFYPSDRMVPFAKVDGASVGVWSKTDVVKKLNDDYKNQKVQIVFGERTEPYRSPLPADIGLVVDSKNRIDSATYQWWLRLLPTSIFWAHTITAYNKPSYVRDDKKLTAYITKELGQSCDVAPINATLKPKETKLEVVSAEAGGICKIEDVKKHLNQTSPTLSTATVVKIPMQKIPPEVSNEQAKKLGDELLARVGTGVAIDAAGQSVVADTVAVLGWLDFSVVEKQLVVAANKDRATEFLTKQIAPKVTRAPGVSKVTTMDFIETARVNGATGQTLDIDVTVQNLSAYLAKTAEKVAAATKPVPPRVEYTRNYSPTDTGLSALMKQYAEAHPGTFGISLVELSGQRRRAAFQDTKQFQTASTYKLFVAYSALKRVESNTWRWSDQISGGRNLEKCFDDMIVRSDNPCAESMLQKIGFRPITDEAKSLGLSATSFLGDVPKTTSNDLATFLATLESGQMFSNDSRNRLIGAMKRNIYRQGIPAGANGQVADKVGFLNGLLHDAAIVYGPSGPAVLCIMTDGSSWATIADLTKQIEALRAR